MGASLRVGLSEVGLRAAQRVQVYGRGFAARLARVKMEFGYSPR